MSQCAVQIDKQLRAFLPGTAGFWYTKSALQQVISNEVAVADLPLYECKVRGDQRLPSDWV